MSTGLGESASTVSWRELLDETEQRLLKAGVAEVSVSARRIIEEASGSEGAELFSNLGQPATVRGVARLDEMVERRAQGEPLQYVVGRWGFRHLDLMVDARVLIPRPETETVAGVALAELDSAATSAPLVADLGTGSGAIGLSIALECPGARVWLSDQSAEALRVARANLAGLGRRGVHVNVVHGSWFEPFEPLMADSFDLIVSNPPYVRTDEQLPPEVLDYEPSAALVAGPVGDEHLVHLVTAAPYWLSGRGSLVLEMAPNQTEALADRASGHFEEVEIFQDLTGRNRGIVARRLR